MQSIFYINSKYLYRIFKLFLSFVKKTLVHIKNLSVQFKGEYIFRDFSYSINKGKKIALTGESGKGKSTLLNVIAGFIPEFTGDITVGGIPQKRSTVKEIRKKIAWLPQDTSLNSSSVEQLIFTPFEFELNKPIRPNNKEVMDLFSIFLLSEELFYKKVKEISGGQKQRVILLTCILLKKQLLLLDEPTSALDKSVKKKISDYILSIPDLTVIASTHDEYWINNSDEVIQL